MPGVVFVQDSGVECCYWSFTVLRCSCRILWENFTTHLTMRCATLPQAIFVNLLIFALATYFYMICTQYWESPQKNSTSSYDREIYLYNRGLLNTTLSRQKHDVQNGRPRIPNRSLDLTLDGEKFKCTKNVEDCEEKTELFKQRVLRVLNSVRENEGNVLKSPENSYNVTYKGPRENYQEKYPKQVKCELWHKKLRTLRREDFENGAHLRPLIPKRQFMENKFYNTCAIVASAGSLINSNLGKFIDSHDVVLRFNHAPLTPMQDVGSKTTIRLVNSQVVTKPHFNFTSSPLYKNITIVLWDPIKYAGDLTDWVVNPEHNFMGNLEAFRRGSRGKVYVVNPLDIWEVWEFLQMNSLSRLRKNPPSSGFLALRLLLPHCNFVDMIQFVPSTNFNKMCHYYDSEENAACTFGIWHPLAMEKLVMYHLSENSDFDVFQTGYIRIEGFKNLKCQ